MAYKAYNKKADVVNGFELISKALKTGNIPGVLALYGEEKYLVNWAANSIINKFVDSSARTFDSMVIDDDKVGIDEILLMADTFPMMSDKKVIWVKNFKALNSGAEKVYGKSGEEALLKYIENPNPSAILILTNDNADGRKKLVTTLKKNGGNFDFPRIDEATFRKFVAQELRKNGKTIGNMELAYLVDKTGYFFKENNYNLDKLHNDLMKIAAHSDKVGITREDIDSCIAGSSNTFVFALINSLKANNKEEALKLLHNMLAKDNNVYGLINLIAGEFEQILAVKELQMQGYTNGRIGAELNIKSSGRVGFLCETASKFSLEKLKEILINTYETDRNIKTGLLPSTMAMELLIARL